MLSDPLDPLPKDTTVSEPSTVPSEAVEAPASEVVLPPVIDTPPVSEPKIEPTAQAPEPEKTAQPEAQNEPDSAPESTAEPAQTQTAQIPASEPLKPEPTAQAPIPVIEPRSRARELLAIARSAMQSRKRKKLEKILGLLEKRTSITNDEVEKLLHVSDATATRYLSTLEKEGKIKQTGKTGKSVSYSKI